MHRQPEHVIAFMLAEMGTTGSVDGSGRLVIRGRFQQKQIENILRRYIGAFSALSGSIPFGGTNGLLGGYSGIRNMQDVQVARYSSHKGESDLLHGVRVLWVQAVRLCYQDGLPSASWSEKEGPSVIIILCHWFLCVPLLAHRHGMDSPYLIAQWSTSPNEDTLRGGIVLSINTVQLDGGGQSPIPFRCNAAPPREYSMAIAIKRYLPLFSWCYSMYDS